MNKSLITIALVLALSACDSDSIKETAIDDFINTNSPAVIDGDISGATTSTATDAITAVLTVSDPDEGESVFQTQENAEKKYGFFTLAAEGAWSYSVYVEGDEVDEDGDVNDDIVEALEALTSGETLTETIDTIRSADYTAATITITITGDNPDNTPATFADLTGTIASNEETTTGKVTVTDVDADQSGVIEETITGTNGDLAITADGSWTYTLDNSVSVDADVEDSIEITSIDGTKADLVITVTADSDAFPATLDEYTFTYTAEGGSYINTGDASGIVEIESSGSAVITTTTGAGGVEETALNLTQITDEIGTDHQYGYLYYSATENAGMDQITGSFTTEAVIKISDRTIAKDIALIDFADTSNYLGFKTYIESDDSSVKFKVYGGTADGNLSTEAKSSEADVFLAADQWYHIVSVYDTGASTYGDITLYINGVVVHTKSIDWLPVDNDGSTDKAVFLGGASSSDKNLDGDVDNIATWNVALTEAQVIERAATFDITVATE